jgi:EAL domain-containing protein (putative c-di-GMP-specific phosphodiesterase class I)
VLNDKDARAIVETTVALGQRLVMSVIAEGVEDQETLQLLCGCQCDQAQGYLFAKPMPGEDIPDWVARWPSVSSTFKD